MTTNRRIRIAVPALLLALTAGACGVAPANETERADDAGEFRGRELPQPIARPDFTFSTTAGDAYDFRARTEGRLALLFFGFTNCPDVCPVHMANLAAVLGDMSIETRRRVEVVFVSADPQRDTPERIRAWLDQFDRGFVGLRAPVDSVDALLRELGSAPVQHGAHDEAGGYTVGHPAQIFAFSPAGPARVVYPFGIRQIDWAHDLPKLLADTAEAAATPAAARSGSAAADSAAGGAV